MTAFSCIPNSLLLAQLKTMTAAAIASLGATHRKSQASLSPFSATRWLSLAVTIPLSVFLTLSLSFVLLRAPAHGRTASLPSIFTGADAPSPFRRVSTVAPAGGAARHGVLHPLLYDQRLSHFALHSSKFLLHMTSLFAPRTVAIAGVEWGADMANFAAAGYRVHAIEPGQQFLDELRAVVNEHPRWDVVLHPFAATDETNGTLAVEYQKEVVASGVRTRRLDHLIVGERLALLSADVQGGELEILRGATALLPDSVDSILVEVGLCNPKVVDILNMLDRDYVMFDFVPWGHAKGMRNESVPSTRNYAVEHDRPAAFGAYVNWLCSKSTQFNWLQTDILAVRRDLIAEVWKGLATLAETQCEIKTVTCILRGAITVEAAVNRSRVLSQ